MKSPATRNLVKSGAVKVVGALYDVGTNRIQWLPVSEVDKILKMVESSPKREMKPLAP
jgi:carbonic anhydrase